MNQAVLTPARNPLLVFDWGNTVMQVLPEFTGPMAAWPRVAEVNGIVEALEALNGRYQMVIASNAGDSDAPMVWKALRRAGLGEYFKAVFTAQELGSRKPDLAFFRQLENVLSRPPHELMMIGDEYPVDILGARQAGWLAAWYNPARQAAPGLIPLHNLEIADMHQLPAALSQAPLPDFTTCLSWLVEAGTPHNILQHIQLVAAVAYQLACWLNERGETIQPLLVQRGAMLHDLKKMESIRRRSQAAPKDNDHARMAYDQLLARGQPELAEIADRHMPVSASQPQRTPRTWEEKLVHYADKLAEGSTLVTLEERIQALRQRYPDFAGELDASQPYLYSLQSELCARLDLSPAELFEHLRKAILF